jgi:hypothetical protein
MQNRHGWAKRLCQSTGGAKEWIGGDIVKVLVVWWKVKQSIVWFLLYRLGYPSPRPRNTLQQCILGKNTFRMICKV